MRIEPPPPAVPPGRRGPMRKAAVDTTCLAAGAAPAARVRAVRAVPRRVRVPRHAVPGVARMPHAAARLPPRLAVRGSGPSAPACPGSTRAFAFANVAGGLAFVLTVGLVGVSRALSRRARLGCGAGSRRPATRPGCWRCTRRHGRCGSGCEGGAFTGLPWLQVGYAQIDAPAAGWLPVLGVHGAGALVCVRRRRARVRAVPPRPARSGVVRRRGGAVGRRARACAYRMGAAGGVAAEGRDRSGQHRAGPEVAPGDAGADPGAVCGADAGAFRRRPRGMAGVGDPRVPRCAQGVHVRAPGGSRRARAARSSPACRSGTVPAGPLPERGGRCSDRSPGSISSAASSRSESTCRSRSCSGRWRRRWGSG